MRCAAKTAVTRSVVMKSSSLLLYLRAMTRLSGKGGLRRSLAAAWRELEVSRNRVSRRFPPPPRHSAARPRKSESRPHFDGGGRVEPSPFDFFAKQASVRPARAAEPAHCEFPPSRAERAGTRWGAPLPQQRGTRPRGHERSLFSFFRGRAVPPFAPRSAGLAPAAAREPPRMRACFFKIPSPSPTSQYQVPACSSAGALRRSPGHRLRCDLRLVASIPRPVAAQPVLGGHRGRKKRLRAQRGAP